MLRLLCVTQEPHLLSGVTQAFPEFDFEIDSIPSLSELESSAANFEILILDLDTLEAEANHVVPEIEFVLCQSRRAIVLVPPRYSHCEPALAKLGVLILHRPATTGELVLALNRVLRAEENACNGS